MNDARISRCSLINCRYYDDGKCNDDDEFIDSETGEPCCRLHHNAIPVISKSSKSTRKTAEEVASEILKETEWWVQWKPDDRKICKSQIAAIIEEHYGEKYGATAHDLVLVDTDKLASDCRLIAYRQAVDELLFAVKKYMSGHWSDVSGERRRAMAEALAAVEKLEEAKDGE